MGQLIESNRDGQHHHSGNGTQKDLFLFGVAVDFPVQQRQQGGTNRSGTTGTQDAHGIHIAGCVQGSAHIDLHPANGGQRQRQHFGNGTNRPALAGQGKVGIGNHKDQQHGRQVNCLGRADERRQHHSGHRFRPAGRAGAQGQAERGKAEEIPQHGGVRRKAARQLQGLGQQCHTGKNAAQPLGCNIDRSRSQCQVQRQVAQPPQQQHAMEANPHHARQRNAGNLPQVQCVVDGVRCHIGIGADCRFAAASRIPQVFQHFLVSVNADITGMIFEIGSIAAAHQQHVIVIRHRLAQQRAGLAVAFGQVGVFIGADKGRR